MGNELYSRRYHQSTQRSLIDMDKIELLYDHYKETFSIIQENLNQRNRFFVMAFFIMTLQFLFAVSPESIATLITTIIRNEYDIDISGQIITIQSLLWLVLLYFTMRYYQSTVHIERQYNYIHTLEATIASSIQISFDREGGNYLKDYPKMNDMIDILYKWIFPIIYCVVIFCKIISEYIDTQLNLSIIFDSIIFLCCFVLTILYLIFLHGKKE